MVCMNLTTDDMSTVGHRLIVQPGTATISATQTLSGNGKQINGWTLTGGAASGFTPSGNAVVRDTGCEGGALGVQHRHAQPAAHRHRDGRRGQRGGREQEPAPA